MTSPNPTLESEKWQQQYSATNSQWQDMKRSGEITVVIAFFIVVATLYAFGYAVSHFEEWLFATTSQTLFYFLLVRMLLIVLTPIIFLFVGFGFIFKQTRELIFSMYQPKMDEKISALIRRRLFGTSPLPTPLNTNVN